ncbi:unnamed protein product [Colias eurytheme]|nr:unnamed protein product [Colias eurytheme]
MAETRTGPQSDVHGALGAACRVCRALGLCPLPLASLAGHAFTLYSFCIMLPLYNLISWMGMRVMYFSPETNMYRYVTNLTCIGSYVLLTNAALLSGQRRMRHWVHCLNLLVKITPRSKTSEKKERKWIIIICLYVGVVQMMSLSHLLVFGWTAGNIYMTLMQVTMTLTTYSIAFQNIFMVARIYSSSSAVNRNLKKSIQFDGMKTSNVKWTKILRNNFLNVSTVLGPSTDQIDDSWSAVKVREQALAYMSICDIIREITASEAVISILLLVGTITRLMLSAHVLVEPENGENLSWILIACLEFIWGIDTTVKTILVIEPCHSTQHQLRMTKVLINVSRRERYNDVEVANELKLFNYLCCLNEPTFSPFGICTLDRSLNTRVIIKLPTMNVLYFFTLTTIKKTY